jgi:hypothetical protein
VGEASDVEYVDEDLLRGSLFFFTGVAFHAKENPHKIEKNDAWFNSRRSEGFVWGWIAGGYKLARIKYPDELLAQTSLEAQGVALGRWVLDSFQEPGGETPAVLS